MNNEITIARIKDVINRAFQRDYKEQSKELLLKVKHTLRNNPHNTFKGTAHEYINKYNLNNQLWYKLKDIMNYNQ